MSYFKKNIWLLPFIGGFITLISVFTPVTTFSPSGNLAYQWMMQLALVIEPAPIEPTLWRTNIPLFLLSVSLTIIVFASAIILITITNIYRKYSTDLQKLKTKWLILGILIALATLIWIISMEIFYSTFDASHWQSYTPNFGVIGPFIGSAFAIFGVYLAKVPRE